MDDPADPLIRSLILASLTALLGLFSAAAYVLSQSHQDPIRALLSTESGHRRAVDHLARRASAYVAGLGTVRAVLIGAIVLTATSMWDTAPGVRHAVLVAALVLVAEFLPRRFVSGLRARHVMWSERLARYVYYLLYPIARVLGSWSGDGGNGEPAERDGSHNGGPGQDSEAEQSAPLRESERPLERQERAMIHRILEFPDTVVSDVMVPRTDMVCVPVDCPLDGVRAVIHDKPFSRLPVYEGSVDNIVGILHLKDLLHHLGSGTAGMRAVMRTAFLVVPESKRINELFAEFRRHRQRLAIVLDEYGGTAGLVTLEDVLEEIVGQIQDEFDSEEAEVVDVGGGVYELDGRVPLDELNESLRLALPEESVNTIGGFLVDLVGRVPAAGQTIDYKDGLRFVVVDADGRRIRRVRILVTAAERESESDGQA